MKAKKEKATVAKATVAQVPAETKKGVVGWQKGLRSLRDLVNMAQLNAESVNDKEIAKRLSTLAKAERAKAEASETIPARLNRRFAKYCA